MWALSMHVRSRADTHYMIWRTLFFCVIRISSSISAIFCAGPLPPRSTLRPGKALGEYVERHLGATPSVIHPVCDTLLAAEDGVAGVLTACSVNKAPRAVHNILRCSRKKKILFFLHEKRTSVVQFTAALLPLARRVAFLNSRPETLFMSHGPTAVLILVVLTMSIAEAHSLGFAGDSVEGGVTARRHYNASKHNHPHPDPPLPGDATLGLRVAGIFLIGTLTALGLGVFFLDVAKTLSTPSLLCMRAFSAGTMVSVAVVHILAEAGHANWGTLFPVPETLFTLGVLLAWAFSVLPGHNHAHPADGNPSSERTGDAERTIGTQMQQLKCNDAGSGAEEAGTSAATPEPGGSVVTTSRVAIESLEIGCVSHSLILGITLGLQASVTNATVLLIVFSLHNFLEALCLGHLFASLQSRTEQVLMVLLTSGSLPIGAVIGIVIERTADKPSSLFTWTSAISCIAGGMLLYSSLVDIVGEDVKLPIVKADKALRFKMFACMMAGCGAMTALAAGEIANGEHAH